MSWENIFLDLLSVTGKIENLKFLDYGCGDGRYYRYLLNKGFRDENIYGVEVSKARVERCKAKGFKNIFFVELKQTLPFEDNTFDFVNFIEVIEHIPEAEIDFYLNEIRRVLKKGGNLILTTPNYPIKRLYDIWHAIKHKKWARLKDDPTHISRYNYKKLEKLVRKYFSNINLLVYKEGILSRMFKKDFFVHKILVSCIK